MYKPVRCENDTPALLDHAGEGVPEEASSVWVHTSTGLVQQQNSWVPYQRHGCAQLTLITTTAIPQSSRHYKQLVVHMDMYIYL